MAIKTRVPIHTSVGGSSDIHLRFLRISRVRAVGGGKVCARPDPTSSVIWFLKIDEYYSN